MRYYELVFIGRQDLTSSQVESLAKHYTKIIKDYEGEIKKTEFCGLRTLAYPIKKNKSGHYVLLSISCKKEGIKEVERDMSLNEDILRYLTVRVEKLDNAPSSLMIQQRTYREGSRSDDGEDEVLTSKNV